MSDGLREAIKRNESEVLEFKKSTAQIEKALKAVCAFLNHKGGAVYFGIDDGKAVGQEISDSTLKSISQKIRQRIKPEISPEIGVLDSEGKKVIEVKVKAGNNKPYYLDGIAYKRAGSENVVISPDELERIILEKRKRYLDAEICVNAGLTDIDEAKLKWFLKEANTRRGLTINDKASLGDVLIQLNLMKENRLTNAAVLLFCKNPQKFFMQSETKCIVLSGSEFVKPYITYNSYAGGLFDQIDKATTFILENIHRPLWVEGGETAAKHPYEIPREAVREIVVNAVAHRDYESPSSIQVRVFPDRVEVWNPGKLPQELNADDLKRLHPSLPRNPLIFKQLYRVAFVEDVGGGTMDVVNKCISSGLPEPVFEEKMGNFVATLWRSVLTDEYFEKMGLNERQKYAVKQIRKLGRMTRAEYEKLLDTSERTANRELEEMRSKKLIEKKGRGPETYYILARFGEIWRDKKRRA